MIDSPRAYWEPLWAVGRRYRQINDAEAGLLTEHLGAGRGRPALDIGSGDGMLAQHLHDHLGYQVTGIDCAPSAVSLATTAADGADGRPCFQVMDFATDDLSLLPAPAYAVITCRLVYRFVADKPAFLDRVRRVLAPGGMVWVVTELADRRAADDPLKALGITATETEVLTSGWSRVTSVDLDHLACYVLRP